MKLLPILDGLSLAPPPGRQGGRSQGLTRSRRCGTAKGRNGRQAAWLVENVN
jgi:hypothetical protein